MSLYIFSRCMLLSGLDFFWTIYTVKDRISNATQWSISCCIPRRWRPGGILDSTTTQGWKWPALNYRTPVETISCSSTPALRQQDTWNRLLSEPLRGACSIRHNSTLRGSSLVCVMYDLCLHHALFHVMPEWFLSASHVPLRLQMTWEPSGTSCPCH